MYPARGRPQVEHTQEWGGRREKKRKKKEKEKEKDWKGKEKEKEKEKEKDIEEELIVSHWGTPHFFIPKSGVEEKKRKEN